MIYFSLFFHPHRNLKASFINAIKLLVKRWWEYKPLIGNPYTDNMQTFQEHKSDYAWLGAGFETLVTDVIGYFVGKSLVCSRPHPAIDQCSLHNRSLWSFSSCPLCFALSPLELEPQSFNHQLIQDILCSFLCSYTPWKHKHVLRQSLHPEFHHMH